MLQKGVPHGTEPLFFVSLYECIQKHFTVCTLSPCKLCEAGPFSAAAATAVAAAAIVVAFAAAATAAETESVLTKDAEQSEDNDPPPVVVATAAAAIVTAVVAAAVVCEQSEDNDPPPVVRVAHIITSFFHRVTVKQLLPPHPDAQFIIRTPFHIGDALWRIKNFFGESLLCLHKNPAPLTTVQGKVLYRLSIIHQAEKDRD